MEKKFYYSLLFMFLFIGLYSCGNDNETYIDPKITTIGDEDYFLKGVNFANTSGEKSLFFTSNIDWSITVANTSNGEKWCSVTPNSGKAGENTIKVKVAENVGVDDRNVSLTLRAGGLTKTITVVQKQRDALTLTTNKFEVGKAGGTINVEVKSNIDYEVIIPETCKSWIKQSTVTRGLIAKRLSFDIATSEEYEKREGEITIRSGELTETAHVYQAGEGILLLTKNEFPISDKGATITVEVKSNFDFDVKMPNVDWIKEITKTRGMSSHTLYYVVNPNESTESREAELVFYDKNSNLNETVKIKQAAADIVNVTKIVLNETYKELYSSESFKLTAIVHPDNATDKTIKWNSSNVHVATVDKDGLITAIAEGEAYITANINDIKESCLVKVKPVKVYENSLLSEVYVFSEGKLDDILTNDEKRSVLKLKITGHINSEDIKTVREQLLLLEDLNISEIDLIMLPDNSFQNMALLKKIELPSSLNSIGCYAFQNCPSLLGISIPDNVETINEGAFSTCISLKHVSFGANSKLKKIKGSIYTTSGGFYRCNSLESIVFPKSTEIIGENCFTDCTSLIEVELPKGISIIESGAFNNCSSLVSIIIPDKLTSINRYTFKDCTSLTNIELPVSLERIDHSAFRNCSSLQLIQLPETVGYIAQFAFGDCTSLQQIKLPEIMGALEWYTFENCKSLTNVIIPPGIKSIHRSFSGCNALKKVTCLAVIPPVVDQFSFSMISKDCELYVLPQYVERYKNNEEWKKIFGERIYATS